jgi:hypothetical protein
MAFMKFRTEITLSPVEFQLSHPDKIMMAGSCFIENISLPMAQAGFSTDVNPFGILYNPVSIAQSLSDLIENKIYTPEALFLHQGVYFSLAHHSRFSGTNKEQVLEQINTRIKQSSGFLKEARLLILTFGTATVYRLLSSGEIVSNCHKLPSGLFREERLPVGRIVRLWDELIKRLQTINPELHILFTVSPVRHWKNGIHENQLNKASLLLAVNELVKENERCYYFPSYEIMMDDLRDYRFYADDMIHPNRQAIDYIWEKFSQAYFAPATRIVIKEWESIQQALNHRPFHPESEEYRAFKEKTEKRKEAFLKANASFVHYINKLYKT